MRPTLLLLMTAAVFAQPQLNFEVGSVKRSAPGETGCVLRPAPGGERYVATCVPLRNVISTASWTRFNQVIGGPAWIDSDPYDITGVAAKPSTILDLHTMMQNLLVERFKLQMHHETKAESAYVLTLDKNGAKNLKSHPPQYASDLTVQQAREGLHEKLSFRATPIDYLVWLLTARVDSAIVNQTGLQGSFDFDLSYTDDPPVRAPANAPPDAPLLDDSGPRLAEALRDQLGLKLEARKAPVDYLVIDHAERPTEN